MITYSFLSARRRLTNQDVTDIRLLFHQLNGKHDRITRAMMRSYAAKARLLISKNGHGRFVGMASLVIVPKIPAPMGWVAGVAVLDTDRGKGIGRRLMEELIKEAERLGVSRVDLSSSNDRHSAHALYLSLGFKKRDTTAFRLDLQDR